jgi:hypothetical protein
MHVVKEFRQDPNNPTVLTPYVDNGAGVLIPVAFGALPGSQEAFLKATEPLRAKIQQCPLCPESDRSRHGSELTLCANRDRCTAANCILIPSTHRRASSVGGIFEIMAASI